jgi:hypothetical protein
MGFSNNSNFRGFNVPINKKDSNQVFNYCCGRYIILFVGWTVVPMGFSYKLNDSRNIPPPSEDLKMLIRQGLQGYDTEQNTLEATLERSNWIVASLLEYDFAVSETNPNKVLKLGKVNCAGYAALQVCVLNWIFQNYNLRGCKAEWHSGKVYYCGTWLGKYLGNHCYPVITDGDGKKYFPDACFKDLFGADYMVEREEL